MYHVFLPGGHIKFSHKTTQAKNKMVAMLMAVV